VDSRLLSVGDLKAAIGAMKSTPYHSVDYPSLILISTAYGHAFALPSIMLGVFGAAYSLFFHRYSRFAKNHSMYSLSHQEVKNWPQIACVLGKNLIKADVEKGSWRMSERPLDFAKVHGLVVPETVKGKVVARLDKAKSRQIFAMQMGPVWSGLEDLPPYVLALFAIFAARGEGDAKGARKLIRQIAASAGEGALNFGGTRLLLFKHVRSSQKVGRAVGPHAYMYTVMASMLELAREEGVLSVSEFLWLKAVDRQLWYMLSSVGRTTAFVEVSAPYSHWMVEKRLRRPLKVPVFDQAIEALDEALSNIVIDPEEIKNG
ncbi:type IVB secretion system coupling complex protein DotM/IcmP, partial [Gammaproteobacteria bacterium]|nr:type IVB secretion system coupling complex protein DotM/IcmP [Gammaproteobacteria bacterium]